MDTILIIICSVSFWGAVVYRIYSLNLAGIVVSILLAVVSFVVIQRFSARCAVDSRAAGDKPRLYNTRDLPLAVLYFALFIACILILFVNRTAVSIVSPWQVVPPLFFAIYALATAVLVLNIMRDGRWALLSVSLHYFLSFSVALIVYKIGYGFDPFVHQATEGLIAKTGIVIPKPFYYLGQYSLVVVLSKLTTLPVALIDKLLLPVLAAIFLPITLRRVLDRRFGADRTTLLTAVALLVLPFTLFIVTTPQNLAYLWLILAILLGFVCSNKYDLAVICLLALTCLVTQPVAGIPAILFVLTLTVYHSEETTGYKKYLYAALFLLAVISLPLAFHIFANNHATPASVTGESGGTAPHVPLIPGSENVILNFIYLYAFNINTIIVILALSGVYLTHRRRARNDLLPYLVITSGLALSYLATKQLPFSFLIEYERSDYANRILAVVTIFLLPFIILAIRHLIGGIRAQNKFIIAAFGIFCVILTTVSLYASYPRLDNYHNSHIYSISQADIDAVRRIDRNASEDYIVLANQQVGAAALREFGFKKYYTSKIDPREAGSLTREDLKSEIFYYPIPTGGPLYQYYLKMVYSEPGRENMLAAMDLAGVDEAYFVLNEYWWAFPKILEEAKLEADGYWETGDEEVFVFKYTR